MRQERNLARGAAGNDLAREAEEVIWDAPG